MAQWREYTKLPDTPFTSVAGGGFATILTPLFLEARYFCPQILVVRGKVNTGTGAAQLQLRYAIERYAGDGVFVNGSTSPPMVCTSATLPNDFVMVIPFCFSPFYVNFDLGHAWNLDASGAGGDNNGGMIPTFSFNVSTTAFYGPGGNPGIAQTDFLDNPSQVTNFIRRLRIDAQNGAPAGNDITGASMRAAVYAFR